MPEHEAAFLLKVLNQEFADGKPDEDSTWNSLYSLIWTRFLSLGFIVEFSADHSKWYARVNDGMPFWDR
jgi:hypothetical protein